MRRLDFPVRPHLLKYLAVHLELRSPDQPEHLGDYVLSSVGRWGLPLTQLLAKPAKSARYEASVEDCTAHLGVNLRNFKSPYYDLVHGKLSPYVVFQFNDYVEDVFREELYWWVQRHRARRGTIKDGILACMAFYEMREEDVAYETLRKDVQRNAPLLLPGQKRQDEKKQSKTDFFSMNLSQKMSGLSQKTGVLSRKETFSVVRQHLMELPVPILETDFYFGPGSTHAHAGR